MSVDHRDPRLDLLDPAVPADVMRALAKTAARGYDNRHKTRRAQWAPKVNALDVACWRCGRLIIPNPALYGDGWALGHDDHDRTITRGPEHLHCNAAAGARKGNRSPLRPRRRVAITANRW